MRGSLRYYPLSFLALDANSPRFAALACRDMYRGHVIKVARKLCLQSRMQRRQTSLYRLLPVIGSRKNAKSCLSLLESLGIVSPPSIV